METEGLALGEESLVDAETGSDDVGLALWAARNDEACDWPKGVSLLVADLVNDARAVGSLPDMTGTNRHSSALLALRSMSCSPDTRNMKQWTGGTVDTDNPTTVSSGLAQQSEICTGW